MFFELSKILGFVALPSNALTLLALAGVVLMATPLARAGRRLVIVAILLLAVAGFSPLGNVLMLPLEQRFPAWDASRGPPDGLIVLGGAIAPDVSAARGEPALNEAAERMTAVVVLARRYPAAPIVFSGGSANLIPTGLAEAESAGRLLESLGIARERIRLESRSRNTAENAAFTKALLAPKPGERWLLVTSAHHMPRSIGAFRGVGFAVEAYPVDWRTIGPADASRPFGSVAAGLARTDAASREWIGLVLYWVTGRLSELFPGPS
jgi:uncharacterized SAM-binding protein YcdF (DUF218 family)